MIMISPRRTTFLRQVALLLVIVTTISNAFTTTTSNFAVRQPQRMKNQHATSALNMGLLDDMGGFLKRFTQKASASHILIKGGAEAENQLEDLKVEIDNSPVKFAEAAAKFSACPSASRGGDLGEFGPGAMVREFDRVVFNEPVGVVHGPIKTQVIFLLYVCIVL